MVDPFPSDESDYDQFNPNTIYRGSFFQHNTEKIRDLGFYRQNCKKNLDDINLVNSDSSCFGSDVDREPEVADVYKQSRYKPDMSPLCIYIPTRFVMFKLMRSCIDVYDPSDLWFN